MNHMIIKTIDSKWEFQDEFKKMDRADNFSREGLNALFDYLDDSDQQIELDVIALCCEFTEYANFAELQENYSEISDMEDLENHTTVIRIDDERFIIADF